MDKISVYKKQLISSSNIGNSSLGTLHNDSNNSAKNSARFMKEESNVGIKEILVNKKRSNFRVKTKNKHKSHSNE